MNSPRRWLRVLSVLVVTCIALALRLRAVEQLPIDYDEGDYLLAGQHYARAIAAGDWDEIVNYDYNYEHPPLTKLVYGAAILPLPRVNEVPQTSTSAPPADSLPEPHFRVARLTAATIGTLQVFALAILNPLAGLFLGIHTWQKVHQPDHARATTLVDEHAGGAVLRQIARHTQAEWLAVPLRCGAGADGGVQVPLLHRRSRHSC